MPDTQPRPIFIAATRSFWLAVLTLAMITEAGAPLANGLAALAEWAGAAVGAAWDRAAIARGIMDVAPIGTFLLALQQRAGASRPYTLDPRAVG